MKILKADMPKLVSFNSDSPFVESDFKILKETGAIAISNGIQIGDEIIFPDKAADVLVQVQEFNGRKSALVGVKRNGQPSWLRISSLHRRDKEKNCICDISTTLNEMKNDSERVTFLLGKTIAAPKGQPVEVFKFVGNVRTGDIVETEFPIIEYK